MGSAYWYGNAMKHLLAGEINVSGGSLKLAFLTSAYVLDQAGHEFFADVAADEVSGAAGTGYTTGGIALANVAVTVDAGTLATKIGADPVSINPATFTARYGVLYLDTGDPATSPLLAVQEADADVSANNAPFQFTPDATTGYGAFTPVKAA